MLYHPNLYVGAATVCNDSENCYFVEESQHYTSVEAAAEAYHEIASSSIPIDVTGLDIEYFSVISSVTGDDHSSYTLHDSDPIGTLRSLFEADGSRMEDIIRIENGEWLSLRTLEAVDRPLEDYERLSISSSFRDKLEQLRDNFTIEDNSSLARRLFRSRQSTFRNGEKYDLEGYEGFDYNSLPSTVQIGLLQTAVKYIELLSSSAALGVGNDSIYLPEEFARVIYPTGPAQAYYYLEYFQKEAVLDDLFAVMHWIYAKQG